MPEIPDLQVFSHNLSKRLSGKRVQKIHAIVTRKLKTDEKEFQDSLEGAVLTSVHREGKALHFTFDNGNVLSLHLMLKGELHYYEKSNENKFTILEILFDDSTGLAMTDFQRQATPTLNPGPREAPDALSREVDYKFLKQMLNRSKTTIKKRLMDQSIIRGIGNAYADEILWHARISPFAISNKIPDPAIERLSDSIKTVLTNAEKNIRQAHPDIISGEVRDLLAIHNPGKTHSPTGEKIHIEERSGRKTYFTKEQERFH
ncbi:MAG: Fpg/Nei family DNA glycosylase [Bacteroidota bacterium]|nr:Fpg/Nei family DNA glycosylase [Bacteroidota bacterium]